QGTVKGDKRNYKPRNRKRVRRAEAATGICPADYPLGSLESRAAVRVLLDQSERMKPPLSDYDRDALTIYRGTFWLHASASPNYKDVEATAIYERGRQLSSTAKAAKNLSARGCFEMSSYFSNLTGEQMRELHEVWLVNFVNCELSVFEQAWKRCLCGLPFPIRLVDNRFLYRNWRGDWEQHEEYSAVLQRFG